MPRQAKKTTSLIALLNETSMKTLPTLTALALLIPCGLATAQTNIQHNRSAFSPLTSGGNTLAASLVDDFETYSVAVGSAENTLSSSIDDLTVTGTGQGPGLVADGCSYSAGTAGTIQWNGDTYFSLSSRTILANGTATLTLTYDSPQGDLSFDLDAFAGFPDTATITGYDSGGNLIFSNPPLTLPGGSPVNYSYVGASVSEIRIAGIYGSWSPMLDNHAYGSGGPILAVSGVCPGPSTVDLSGATPFGLVAFANGSVGSFLIPNGSCAGVSLDISNPTLLGMIPADLNGTISLPVNLPTAFCGTTLQAVDLTSCTVSNTVVL